MKSVSLAVALLALAAPPLLAQSFDAAAEAETCAACHGADGIPLLPEAPIIWGQQFYYLYVQLRDYASGLRDNATMSPMAAAYDKEQLQALAEHFAAQPWPNIATDSPAAIEDAARAALDAGECSQCHNTYAGDSRIPRLAGQTETYLLQTLLDFKHRVRMNAPDKAFLMQTFEEDQLEAIARYLAAL